MKVRYGPCKSYVVAADVVALSLNQKLSCSMTLITVQLPSAGVLQLLARKNNVFPSDTATGTRNQDISLYYLTENCANCAIPYA